MRIPTPFQRSTLAVLAGWLASLWILLGVEFAFAAGVIVDSKGFESPFAAGPLQGQFGWLNAGSGSTSATVQNAIAQSGSQAVLVTRSANSDQRWGVPQTAFPTQRFVAIDWDMRVSQPSNLTAFGPFFGADSYDDQGAAGQLGSLGVDATTGDVLFQAQGTGILTETGTVVSFNQWNHFRMVLDFTAHNYRGYVNGVLVSTTGFIDHTVANPLDNFSDGDIAAFAAAGDPTSQALSASAVFDNFLIRDGLLGDYDIDGDVDAADYTRWKSTFGTAVTAGTNADGNSNGVVDAADYPIWRDNLGASLFSGAGAGSAINAVPEPSAIVILLIGLSSCGWFHGAARHNRATQARLWRSLPISGAGRRITAVVKQP